MAKVRWMRAEGAMIAVEELIDAKLVSFVDYNGEVYIGRYGTNKAELRRIAKKEEDK